jgi:hypothetical protein
MSNTPITDAMRARHKSGIGNTFYGEMEEHARRLERELAAVDDRLARRPAIAGLSRLFAIEWACSEAGKADKLQAEVARLRALLDEVREILPELIECVEENTNDWPIAKAANAVLAKLEGGRG